MVLDWLFTASDHYFRMTIKAGLATFLGFKIVPNTV
jgi:hypothetical protein